MKILDNKLERQAQKDVIEPLLHNNISSAVNNISHLLDALYDNIPDNKRISYGRVHTIKVLAGYLHSQFNEAAASGFTLAANLFESSSERKTMGVALCLLSLYGGNVDQKTLHYFKTAAESDDWEVREFSQMFFRKITCRHPKEMHPYLLKMARSKDPKLRRFVGETLRPCVENQWIYGQPEYSLTVLRHMFQEKAVYPRTAVGNNLSDLARRLPELVYDVIAELVQTGDKNAYWIAYRACRNLVKKEPQRVMDLLNINEYRYKKMVYHRESV